MANDRAIDRNTIVIDRKTYWTDGKVRLFDAAQQPGKIVIGEVSAADNPNASEWNIDDLRGGIGVEIADPTQDADRAWWSTLDLRRKGRFFLQRLATKTANSPAADIGAMEEFKNAMYATFSTAVHTYNNSTNTWGSALQTLDAAATDMAQGLVGGVETLVIATGASLYYSTDGSSWTQNTENIKYVIFWKDLLWGITNTGQLYYTDDLSTAWSSDALLQLPAGYITGMLVSRGRDQEEHIFAVTKVGLSVHDDVHNRFLTPAELKFPFHNDAGQGAIVWRGDIYYPAGNAVYKIQIGDTTIIVPVGPDLDHGLPQDRRGVIVQLLGTHNDLIALLDASQASGISTPARVSRGVGKHHGFTAGVSQGFSEVLGRDDRGWEVKWITGTSGRGITAGVVANAYSTYRMWWSENQEVYYQQLPVDVVNPLQVPTSTYAADGLLETPWNDMGIRNQTKVALDVLVESVSPSTSEYLTVEYAKNYDDTSVGAYTLLTNTAYTDGRINVTGETKFRILVGGDPIGDVFRAIKFRVKMVRGSTTTSTPQLIKLTLVWDNKINVLYGVSAVVQVKEKAPDGRNVKQQVEDLKASKAKGELSEVTYRNNTTEAENYYMRIRDLQSLEEAGGEYKVGDWNVTAVEPRQSRDRG
jgi:hypothetical protein